MTLPDERFRSLEQTRQFLIELSSDTKKYPRIGRSVREQARSLLRHYPSSWDLDLAAHYAPSVLESSRKIEPLMQWILEGKDQKSVDSSAE